MPAEDRAVVSGDPERARAAARQHLAFVYDTLTENSEAPLNAERAR